MGEFKVSEAELKTVRQVFADLKMDSNILDVTIKNLKLFKKSNKIELDIYSKEAIRVRDLALFEKYLEKRFDIKNICIDITYLQDILELEIQKEWSDIVEYMSQKYPLTRALLRNSKIEIVGKKINCHACDEGTRCFRGKRF